MKTLSLYVTGINKNGEDVNARAFSFPKNADIKDCLRTMKSLGLFSGWDVITKVYDLKTSKLLAEYDK